MINRIKIGQLKVAGGPLF